MMDNKMACSSSKPSNQSLPFRFTYCCFGVSPSNYRNASFELKWSAHHAVLGVIFYMDTSRYVRLVVEFHNLPDFSPNDISNLRAAVEQAVKRLHPSPQRKSDVAVTVDITLE
jgi:hypothetical protein